VQLKLDQEQFSLNDLALTAQLDYLTNASQTIHLSTHVSGNIQANLQKQTFNLTGIDFDLNQVLQGHFNLNVKNYSTLSYAGNISLDAFSLPDLAASLGFGLPSFPNKAILNQVSASSNFVGNTDHLSLNPIQLNFTGTQIVGSIDISSFVPLRVAESLTADQLDLANFVSLNGAKLPMQNLAVSGTLSNGRSLSINQNILVQNMTLQGFDLKALIDQINQLVTNLLNVRNLVDLAGQVNTAMGNVKNAAGSINASNGKTTNLGSLKARVVVSQGLLTTPTMNIKGPLVEVNGRGQVDLSQKTINYTLVSQLVAPGKIQGLVIPYKLSGPFAQMQQGVEWPVVQAEILKYLTVALGSTVTNSVDSVVGGAVNALKGLLGR
jgi:hypothetical protein